MARKYFYVEDVLFQKFKSLPEEDRKAIGDKLRKVLKREVMKLRPENEED